MNTLLLRLTGPMQSWGTQSRFQMRDTQLEPSKSGVIGLLCAAEGTARDSFARINTLANLKMGVRVDCEGTKEYDYQTVRGILSADETDDTRSSVGKRYYLADASFLIGLESYELDLLKDLQSSLATPQWFLFLGRKSFVPSKPVLLCEDPNHGMREGKELFDALRNYPWLGRTWQKRPTQLRYIIEHYAGEQTPADQPITQINDQPLSFDIHNRRYAPRHVRTIIEPPEPKIFEHLAERVGENELSEDTDKEVA